MQPLRIAGIHRSSTIDFPQKVATVVFTQGCNLRCPWCRQGRLIPHLIDNDSPAFNPEKCLAFIRSRADLIDAVVITGGEPLLQESLPGFLSSIKELGLLVKVDTNGTLPHRLHHLLDEALVDYVALDIKAPVGNPGAYCMAAGGRVDTSRVAESVRLIAQIAPHAEFRTTALPGFHDYGMLADIVSELPVIHPFYVQLFIPELARAGQWTRQPRWSRDRLENIAARLSLDFPTHDIRARA